MIRLADLAVTIPDANGVVNQLSEWPLSVNELLTASPGFDSIHKFSLKDDLKQMYARYPATTSDQFQREVKADCFAAHPYPMTYVLYLCYGTGNVPPASITLMYKAAIRYSGYFTDPANNYDS